MYWQLKVAVLLAFFGFWVGKCDAQLGTPPIIAVQPVGCTVPKGGTITLTSTATSLTPMNFTWIVNGHQLSANWVSNTVVPLVGTVSTLTIKNASMGNTGSYTMTVSNAVGATTSINANVTVTGNATAPMMLSIVTNGPAGNGFGIQVSAPDGSNFVLEASSDFRNWQPLCTNKGSSGTITYTDTDWTNYPARFYRTHYQ
jgi:hypothetical protein